MMTFTPNADIEQIEIECGVQVDSRLATHIAESPGAGWEPLRWKVRARSNSDPRFSVVWWRPKDHLLRSKTAWSPTSIIIHFGDDYDDNVLRAIDFVESSIGWHHDI
jgi:hypothetical protein